VEDDHVDRPGVDAQQCVQLTGTNRSFGLIALVAKARDGGQTSSLVENPVLLRLTFFAGLVALGEAIRPDPIPNSAVKRLRANGTLSQDTGE
jgi:hypothetical protein